MRIQVQNCFLFHFFSFYSIRVFFSFFLFLFSFLKTPQLPTTYISYIVRNPYLVRNLTL